MKQKPSVRYEVDRVLIRVPLADSQSPEALADALSSLNGLLRTPNTLDDKKHPDLDYLVTTFHTPDHTWIREKLFFKRCARHLKLRPAMVEYTELVNRKARKLGEPLGHGDMHPAGSFAIVPLALHHRKYIAPLIAHLRGWDMDHESFHPALIEELLRRHGICEETLDLLAWRAIESDGQKRENLNQAVRDHDLLGALADFGGIAGFADRAWKINQRKNYLSLYIANGGRALFAGKPDLFAEWLRLFEKRGVKFDASERSAPEKKLSEHSVPEWPDDFEDDEEAVP